MQPHVNLYDTIVNEASSDQEYMLTRTHSRCTVVFISTACIGSDMRLEVRGFDVSLIFEDGQTESNLNRSFDCSALYASDQSHHLNDVCYNSPQTST